MALALAESLVETGQADPADQLARYLRWQRDGHLSATGQCVGISAETVRALAQAQWTRQPMAGSHDPSRPGKEPLARIGPAIAMFLPDPEHALEAAVDAARVAHQAPATLDADCRYLGGLLGRRAAGCASAELLRPMSPVEGYWQRHRLRAEVAAVARGSWAEKEPARVFGGGAGGRGAGGGGTCFDRARNFRDAVLAAANLGGDADATAAITTSCAGAHYGAPASRPPGRLHRPRADLRELADGLLERALARINA